MKTYSEPRPNLYRESWRERDNNAQADIVSRFWLHQLLLSAVTNMKLYPAAPFFSTRHFSPGFFAGVAFARQISLHSTSQNWRVNDATLGLIIRRMLSSYLGQRIERNVSRVLSREEFSIKRLAGCRLQPHFRTHQLIKSFSPFCPSRCQEK